MVNPNGLLYSNLRVIASQGSVDFNPRYGCPTNSEPNPDAGVYSPLGRHASIMTMHETFDHTADLGLRVRAADLDTLFNEAGQVVLSYRVFRAWVSEYQAIADLDANANAVLISSASSRERASDTICDTPIRSSPTPQ